MKLRGGFVSNSSTSSYTCDICMETVAERDLSLGDAGMYICENGHTFCEGHGDVVEFRELSWERLQQYFIEYAYGEEHKQMFREASSPDDIEDYDDWLCDISYEWRGELPSELCPICNFRDLPDRELVKALFKHYGLTRLGTVLAIRKQFKTYTTFKEWLNED